MRVATPISPVPPTPSIRRLVDARRALDKYPDRLLIGIFCMIGQNCSSLIILGVSRVQREETP